MRNEKTLVILAVAAIAAASCQPKEEFGSLSTVPVGDVTITATFEQPDDGTKTSMNSTGKVLWSAGDEVAVMTPTTKDKFTLSSGDKSASAEFTGTITGEAPYYLLYPYSDGCTVADGKLKFSLPQVQTISKAGTFAQGASPAVAFMSDYGVQAQFKNLCGILEINVCGTSVTVAKVVVSDLGGNSLWGDCEVALDGTQGTDEQKMTVSGGSNTIVLNLTKPVSLKASSASLFDVVVPAGTLSKGYSVRVLDADGNVESFITTQNPAAKACRSKVSVMTKVKLDKDYAESKDVMTRGYYKELFVDRGKGLSGQINPPAADSLGWQHDYLDTNDSTFQYSVITSSDDDLNGVLLYPDFEPRYRMIYVNGGQSNSHGKALGQLGLDRIATFVRNGGGYNGTCAGCFLASRGYDSHAYTEEYMGIWPGHMQHTGLADSCTHLAVEPGSPLLKYYDFGGDMQIDSVYHNLGGFMQTEEGYSLPEGTEILLRYVYPESKKNHMKIAEIAYKADEYQGRIVITGSHPEKPSTGERMHLMAAMMRYATDGNGIPTAKGVLVNGEERMMDKLSTEENPEYSRIGDKQYHHFKLEVPAGGIRNLKIKLASDSDKYLTLALRKGDFAWRSDADFLLAQSGCNKTLSIDSLPEGTWYVSVYCPDAPTITCGSSLLTIKGDKSLLNGVPYSITASWE